MTVPQMFVMAFRASVAVAGLVLLFLRNEQSQNKIKVLGLEFDISTPGLVVFLVGCGVLIVPLVIPIKNVDRTYLDSVKSTEGKSHKSPPSNGGEQAPNPSKVLDDEEQKSNNDIIIGRVEPYRIRTDYLGYGNVEFSVFVNDVQVGSYSSDDVIADITRFIKPGPNKVRVAWTADPTMNSAEYADLIVEMKQDATWSSIITRRVSQTTKSGEIISNVEAGVVSQ